MFSDTEHLELMNSLKNFSGTIRYRFTKSTFCVGCKKSFFLLIITILLTE